MITDNGNQNGDRLLSISEFASLSGIKRANLIYYDEIDVLKPVERGENNYRMYSSMQLDLAYVIVSLRNMGVSLKEITEYVQKRTPQKASQLFENQIQAVNEEIDKLQQLKEIMHRYVDNIALYKDVKTPKIEVVEKQSEIICLGPAVNQINDKVESIIDFVQLCRRNGINYVNHTGRLFSEQAIRNQQWSSPDYFYIKSSKGGYEKEAGLYVILTDRCPSDGSNKAFLYESLHKNIEKYNLEICGNTYEEYVLDEISIHNPNDYLIQISVRVR